MKLHIFCLFTLAFLVSCEPENTPPVAVVKSVPGMGDSTTVFMLDASGSADEESSVYVLRYRWDCDGDGVWDTDYSTRTSHASRFQGPGYSLYRVEVTDPDGGTAVAVDSVFILSFKAAPDTLTDPRDGNRYPVTHIGSLWWMAENLRYGSPVDQKTYPQADNDLSEFIYFNNNPDWAGYGSLYIWEEANVFKNGHLISDVCPPGWRIPSVSEWSALFKNYKQPFDVLYYFGPSSIENLGIRMDGYYEYGNPDHPLNGQYLDDQMGVSYWTSQFSGNDSVRTYSAISFTRDTWSLRNSSNRTAWIYHDILPIIIGYHKVEACYVRCVKE